MRPQVTNRFGLSVLFGVLSSVIIGCATPFFSTDSKLLLYLPGAERRSDAIPGFVRPWERVKLIEEKGKKGQKATEEEKNILLVQLSDEFDKNISPHIRRAVVEATARISTNYSSPAAERIFREAVNDDDLELNLSACRALSEYCADLSNSRQNTRERNFAAELLCEKYNSLPFLLAAGSEEENNRRKDIRIAILRSLGNFTEDDSPQILPTLQSGLEGEKLDNGALQTTSCASLAQVTGKKYGLDAEAWSHYLAYRRGEETEPPPEKTIMSALPKLSTETGIFK